MRCEACGKPMPLDGRWYISCDECFHVYLTEQDLIDATNKLNREINEATGMGTEAPTFNGEPLPEIPMVSSGADVHYCPCCLHSF